MPRFSTERAQRVSHRQIIRFGSSSRVPGAVGKLRRGAVERTCYVAVLDYTPREQSLRLEYSRRALISVIGLAIPPDHELDKLVVGGEVFRLTKPPEGPRPGGVPIFHDCEVQYESRVGA